MRPWCNFDFVSVCSLYPQGTPSCPISRLSNNFEINWRLFHTVCSSSQARGIERTKKNPEYSGRKKETQAVLLPFLGPTALPPLPPPATAKVACCWGKGEEKVGQRRKGDIETGQLGLAARGAAPAGGGEGQNEKGRTLCQFLKDKDARHLPPSLLLCPHSNRAGKYQSQSTNINSSHTINSASPLLSIPNSPNALPPLSLLLHR